MCETVPRVFAALRRRPRARLLPGAPPLRARRIPPARVVVAPRVAPSSASSPFLIVADGNGNQTEIQATRAGRRRARWARCGVATRAGRRHGAQPHTEYAPLIGHRPARTVVHFDVWALPSVDSQSESPEQETRRITIQLSPKRARLRVNN
jgi:hypothetical protein